MYLGSKGIAELGPEVAPGGSSLEESLIMSGFVEKDRLRLASREEKK